MSLLQIHRGQYNVPPLASPMDRLLQKARCSDVQAALPRLAITPSCGEEGVAAYAFFGMRPASHASRPACTAFRMADAIRTGSFAAAIAVFINTPSQPSSMAIAASDAVPTPASTSTGTLALSMMI